VKDRHDSALVAASPRPQIPRLRFKWGMGGSLRPESTVQRGPVGVADTHDGFLIGVSGALGVGWERFLVLQWLGKEPLQMDGHFRLAIAAQNVPVFLGAFVDPFSLTCISSQFEKWRDAARFFAYE